MYPYRRPDRQIQSLLRNTHLALSHDHPFYRHFSANAASVKLTAIYGDLAEARKKPRQLPPVKAEVETIRQELQRGRFSDETLQILESLLVCKDAKSLMETRSSLTEFMRSKSLSVMRDITEKTVEQKLWIMEFFVRAFALLGDIEGCLALKYESLLLRQVKSSGCPFLQVSSMEWLNFAEHLLDNGFYPIARQACENALLGIQKDDVVNAKICEFSGSKRIKRIRDHAVISSASGSVQAQATEYLKRKTIEKSNICSPVSKDIQSMANILFRNGIKKRNVRQLLESQRPGS
ncbi:hypothetical protein GH714_012951 [Hevea brasiliensis]|uniref:Uncharacterized protein n=1 Tax=Hevea brasiliensis TaxID=3981 RepID=A0A6A6M4U2_HEVBR|nr:hypothetical protein GH714_012951 [Hevea brasiliensis]